MISLPLFECISPIENVVFVVLAQMDWFNPKSFSCDVKKATFFLSATVLAQEILSMHTFNRHCCLYILSIDFSAELELEGHATV